MTCCYYLMCAGQLAGEPYVVVRDGDILRKADDDFELILARKFAKLLRFPHSTNVLIHSAEINQELTFRKCYEMYIRHNYFVGRQGTPPSFWPLIRFASEPVLLVTSYEDDS
jgi:hypothetical protein